MKSIRDEYLNPEALQKMLNQRSMMGTLDKIQKLMMEGKMEEAMAELARLQEQLKSLQAAIDRSRAEYGMGKYAELAQAMARMQGELNMIAETQRKLMDSTQKIRQRLIDKLKKTGEARLKALFKKLRKRVKKIIKKVEGIDKADMDTYMSRDIDGILRSAKMLDMLLKSLDVAGSLDTAQKLARLTELFRLLGDATRARLLYALLEAGELCVCDLAAATGTPETNVSHALRLLRTAGVVKARRDGRMMDYILSRQLDYLVDWQGYLAWAGCRDHPAARCTRAEALGLPHEDFGPGPLLLVRIDLRGAR